MVSPRRTYLAFYILLALSALFRGFVAGFIELGNDEVYYLTYARFPALSHFDHPPMVGLVIQFFTFNLAYDSEFFVRLAAVVFGTLSTGLMFLIGKQIRNPLTGLYAALLYTASFYGFILSGTFMLPDAPQVFFWLVTLYLLLLSLPDREMVKKSRNFLLLAAVTAGLALLSKYHSVFLLTGVVAYVLFYQRGWLKTREFYLFFLIVALISAPIFFWNIENNFISFTFHESRISLTESGLRPQFFLTEIVGEFLYNNPVNMVILIAALVAVWFRRRFLLEKPCLRILLWTSIPLILVFQSFSLVRSTLPHWTGPGYLGLIFISAAFLEERRGNSSKPGLIPWPLTAALALMLAISVTTIGQIRYGWVPLKKWHAADPSLDMTGWEQLGTKFDLLAKYNEDHGLIGKNAPIVTFRWFPAANFDYYLGRRISKPVYALGTLERIHKYHWINRINGNLRKGSDAWFISLSDDYEDPVALYGSLFMGIVPTDTLYITRGRDTVRRAFVFRMTDLKEEMVFTGRID